MAHLLQAIIWLDTTLYTALGEILSVKAEPRFGTGVAFMVSNVVANMFCQTITDSAGCGAMKMLLAARLARRLQVIKLCSASLLPSQLTLHKQKMMNCTSFHQIKRSNKKLRENGDFNASYRVIDNLILIFRGHSGLQTLGQYTFKNVFRKKSRHPSRVLPSCGVD